MSDIDLRKLSAGDSVKFRNGESALLLAKKDTGENDYPLEISLYYRGAISTMDYKISGVGLYEKMDVIEIIPNPRRWTDEDMKNAFEKGNEYTRFAIDADGANKWLDQYKVK